MYQEAKHKFSDGLICTETIFAGIQGRAKKVALEISGASELRERLDRAPTASHSVGLKWISRTCIFLNCNLMLKLGVSILHF